MHHHTLAERSVARVSVSDGFMTPATRAAHTLATRAARGMSVITLVSRMMVALARRGGAAAPEPMVAPPVVTLSTLGG